MKAALLSLFHQIKPGDTQAYQQTQALRNPIHKEIGFINKKIPILFHRYYRYLRRVRLSLKPNPQPLPYK